MADDTIVGMLRKELANTPQGKWEPAQRERQREHLLGMIAEREEAIARQQRKDRLYKVFERLIAAFILIVSHVAAQMFGIPGLS